MTRQDADLIFNVAKEIFIKAIDPTKYSLNEIQTKALGDAFQLIVTDVKKAYLSLGS